MGVWKERGLEVKRSFAYKVLCEAKRSKYVSGRLDVHHPCDPPRQGGLAIVRAGFLFAQNPMKKTSFLLVYAALASPSASQTLQDIMLRLLLLRLRKI